MRPFLNAITRWELLILLVASPLLLFPTLAFGAGVLVVPLLWAIRKGATGRFVVPTPLDVPVVVLLAMTGVGQLVSADPLFSVSKTAGVLLGVGTYYALAGLTAQRDRGVWLGIGLFISMIVGIAAVSLLATAWVSKFPVFDALLSQIPQWIRAVPGSPPDGFNPNSVAGMLLFALPLLLMLVISRHAPLWATVRGAALPLRVTMALLVVGIGLLFIATQSRAGYASLLVSGAALWFLPRPRWLAGAAAIGVVAVVLFWLSPYRAPLLARLENASSEGGALSTISGRTRLWQRAGQALQDFPFTGVGLGMFRYVQPRLYPLYTVPPQEDIGHAHNQFLQAGLDVGIPGLLAFIALWVGAARLALRVLWRRHQARFYPLMLALLAGWLGHFIWATIETNAIGSKGAWLWWWALGLMVLVYLNSENESPYDPALPPA